MARNRILGLLDWLVDKLAVVNIEGTENLPATGPALLTTAHTSRLDTVFLVTSTERNDAIPVVAREYQKSVLGPILNAMGVIWLERNGSDFKAFKEIGDYLAKGWILGIAPEGQRSRINQLMPGKPGAALIAKKYDVMLVPAALEGVTDMWYWFKRLKKMRVTVRFGEAFRLPRQRPDEDNKTWLANATEEIMCRIAVLLPAERRGFYKDNPCLTKLSTEPQN